jgi:hypothetical protein
MRPIDHRHLDLSQNSDLKPGSRVIKEKSSVGFCAHERLSKGCLAVWLP